jgi:hypothetical protein
MQRIHPLDGEKQGMRVSPGSGYQAPRTSHEPQAELRASHDYGMMVRHGVNCSTNLKAQLLAVGLFICLVAWGSPKMHTLEFIDYNSFCPIPYKVPGPHFLK